MARNEYSRPGYEASRIQENSEHAPSINSWAVCLALVLIPFVSIPQANAGFSQSSLSMAGQSISGGFVAKADDPSAIFLNPAGISQISRSELSLSYSKPFAGLTGVSFQQGYAALAVPINRRWTLGLAGNSFDANGLLTEQEGGLGVVVQVSRRLAVGTNVTYLRHSYNVTGNAAADPLFAQGRAKGAMGIDAGALLTVSRFVTLGFSGRHLNRPDVGLKSKDIVPMELLGGAKIHMGQLSLLADVMVRDAGQDIANRREITWAAGTEWSVLSSLALRAGLNRGSLAAGMGFNVGDFRLDYSFSLSNFLEQDAGGGHHAVLSYRFGRDRYAERPKEAIAAPKRLSPPAVKKSESAPVSAPAASTEKSPAKKSTPAVTSQASPKKNAAPVARKTDPSGKKTPYNFLKKGF